MNYCNIDNDTLNHLKNLIRFLIDEINSACGDGDALWYSQHFNVKELEPILQSVFEEKKQFSEFKWFNDKSLSIWFGGQDHLLVTNDVELFNNRPSWQQCTIVL